MHSHKDFLTLLLRNSALPWYELSDVPASEIVRAYCPKGANNIEQSCTNLVSPGSGDALMVNVETTFDPEYGWMFDGLTQSVSTGEMSLDDTMTTFIRFSNGNQDEFNVLFGNNMDTINSGYCLDLFHSGSKRFISGRCGGKGTSVERIVVSEVVAINADYLYIYGEDAYEMSNSDVYASRYDSLIIGAGIVDGIISNYSSVYVQTFMVHNNSVARLTLDQMQQFCAKISRL